MSQCGEEFAGRAADIQVHRRAFGVGLLELVRWEMGDVRLLCLWRVSQYGIFLGDRRSEIAIRRTNSPHRHHMLAIRGISIPHQP